MPQAQNASTWLQVQGLLNSVNHIFIFLIGAFFFVFARSFDFKETAGHMFATGIGFHVLMAQALMSHYKVNPMTRWMSHRNKSRYHGLMQFVGCFLILLGAVGKFTSKDVHFNTWHGIFGTMAAVGGAAGVLGGLVNMYQPKFVLKLFSPSELRLRHNFFGLITFTLGMTAIFLGYSSKFFTRHVDNKVIPAFMVTTVLVYFLTVIGPVGSLLTKLKYKRQKRQEQQQTESK